MGVLSSHYKRYWVSNIRAYSGQQHIHNVRVEKAMSYKFLGFLDGDTLWPFPHFALNFIGPVHGIWPYVCLMTFSLASHLFRYNSRSLTSISLMVSFIWKISIWLEVWNKLRFFCCFYSYSFSLFHYSRLVHFSHE